MNIIEKVKNGELNGEIVWICDFRYSDISNFKPVRHVKPTKVLIRSNSETKKRIYYSKSHFVELNKDGKPLNSKIHNLYDNTGYRSFTGTPLNIFFTEKECVKCYNEQCEKVKNDLIKFREKIDEKIKLIDTLKK